MALVSNSLKVNQVLDFLGIDSLERLLDQQSTLREIVWRLMRRKDILALSSGEDS